MAKISTNDDKESRQLIIDAVVASMKAKEFIISVRGPFLTGVLLQDGNYKQKPIQPTMELMFKGMRPGARSAFVFEFEPVDCSEFRQVEFEEKKIFDAMPHFEQALVNALGFYDDLSWASAKSKFLVDRRAQLDAEAELLREEQRALNEADPEWGMF